MKRPRYKPLPYTVVELPIDYDAPPKINRRNRRFIIIGPPGCKPWWRPKHRPADAQPNECWRMMGPDDEWAKDECRMLNDAYALGTKAPQPSNGKPTGWIVNYELLVVHRWTPEVYYSPRLRSITDTADDMRTRPDRYRNVGQPVALFEAALPAAPTKER